MIRVYISGALAGTKDIVAARSKYELLGASLRNSIIDVHIPHLTTDPVLHAQRTPEDVYRTDLEALSSCQVLVAFLDEPSLGVGAEIAIAISQGKLVIGLQPVDQKESRFITGLLESSSLGRVIRYDDKSKV